MGDTVKYLSCTVTSGSYLFTEIDISAYRYLSLFIPSDWTTANITAQGSYESGGTLFDVVDDNGIELVITATSSAGKAIGIDTNALKLAAFSFIRLRSGTSSTPVNQVGAKTIFVGCKG